MIPLFIKGLLIGLIVTIPVGPIGILCLTRFLTHGPLYGMISGIGGACADIIFANIGAMGLAMIEQVISKHIQVLQLISAAFLSSLGIYMIAKKEKPDMQKGARKRSLLEAFFSTLFITLANPLLIFSFIAFFSLFSIETKELSRAGLLLLSSGILVGSCTWWFLLAVISSLFNYTFNHRTVQFLKNIAGVCIIIIALVSLIYGFH
jgi:threonine/homoserine/homoserine lactone efflux protein